MSLSVHGAGHPIPAEHAGKPRGRPARGKPGPTFAVARKL